MKLTATFALIAFTSASHQVKQADDTQTQADTQSQAAGYEQDAPVAQEYGGLQTYAPEVQSCFGNCPAHAHCAHKTTGECVAPIVAYEAPSQFWASSSEYSQAPTQTGYTQGRRLQGYERTAQTAQQTYTPHAQAYTQSYEAPPKPHTTCPPGTVNMNCRRLGSRTVLWVAFGLLFIPALWMFWVAFNDSAIASVASWNADDHFLGSSDAAQAVASIRLSRFISGMVCFVASLAYLTMALGYGYTTRCCDGRQFFYARYVDWAITTPLMIWKILERTEAADHEKYFLITMDILMIVAGLIGSLVCGNNKWAFFGFSMLCFLPVMYYICAFKDSLKNDLFASSYNQAVAITFCTWIIYPVVWILAEGTGTICAQAEAICYTVLDIIAKSVFGFVLCSARALWRNNGVVVNGGSML
jgi:bacteriorhodopsin